MRLVKDNMAARDLATIVPNLSANMPKSTVVIEYATLVTVKMSLKILFLSVQSSLSSTCTHLSAKYPSDFRILAFKVFQANYRKKYN